MLLLSKWFSLKTTTTKKRENSGKVRKIVFPFFFVIMKIVIYCFNWNVKYCLCLYIGGEGCWGSGFETQKLTSGDYVIFMLLYVVSLCCNLSLSLSLPLHPCDLFQLCSLAYSALGRRWEGGRGKWVKERDGEWWFKVHIIQCTLRYLPM